MHRIWFLFPLLLFLPESSAHAGLVLNVAATTPVSFDPTIPAVTLEVATVGPVLLDLMFGQDDRTGAFGGFMFLGLNLVNQGNPWDRITVWQEGGRGRIEGVRGTPPVPISPTTPEGPAIFPVTILSGQMARMSLGLNWSVGTMTIEVDAHPAPALASVPEPPTWGASFLAVIAGALFLIRSRAKR